MVEKRNSIDTIKIKNKIGEYLFTAPAIITLAALLLYPFCYGIYISFFKTNLVNKWKFVGFGNYLEVFSSSELWMSFFVTFKFTVFVVIGHFILGFIFALVLNRDVKGRVFFRAILLLPWLFPEVVIANLFKWIFHASTGIFNSTLLALGIIDEPMAWISNPKFALAIVVFACIWKGFPLIMIQILAGLQTISKDITEAATIDGANMWQIFFVVTLPGMKKTLIVSLILDTIWWFKHVTMIWLITQGGPGGITNTISVDIYKRAFVYFDFGSSAAIAVLVFLICVAISLVYRRMLKDD